LDKTIILYYIIKMCNCKGHTHETAPKAADCGCNKNPLPTPDSNLVPTPDSNLVPITIKNIPMLFFETFQNTLPESTLLQMVFGTIVTVSVFVVKNVVLKEFIAFLKVNGFDDIKVVSRLEENNSTITATLVGFSNTFPKVKLPELPPLYDIFIPSNLKTIFYEVFSSVIPEYINNNIDFAVVEIAVSFSFNNSNILEEFNSYLESYGFINTIIDNGNTNNNNLLKLSLDSNVGGSVTGTSGSCTIGDYTSSCGNNTSSTSCTKCYITYKLNGHTYKGKCIWSNNLCYFDKSQSCSICADCGSDYYYD